MRMVEISFCPWPWRRRNGFCRTIPERIFLMP
jgi:hypothetical protein